MLVAVFMREPAEAYQTATDESTVAIWCSRLVSMRTWGGGVKGGRGGKQGGVRLPTPRGVHSCPVDRDQFYPGTFSMLTTERSDLDVPLEFRKVT